jgi:hypothetical protein
MLNIKTRLGVPWIFHLKNPLRIILMEVLNKPIVTSNIQGQKENFIVRFLYKKYNPCFI